MLYESCIIHLYTLCPNPPMVSAQLPKVKESADKFWKVQFLFVCLRQLYIYEGKKGDL